MDMNSDCAAQYNLGTPFKNYTGKKLYALLIGKSDHQFDINHHGILTMIGFPTFKFTSSCALFNWWP